MSRIPEIKRTVRSFLIEEEGRISKKNLVRAGVVIASIAAAELVSADTHNQYNPTDCPGVTAPSGDSAHSNSLSVSHPDGYVAATHNHCVETHAHWHDSGGGGGGWW